MFTYDQRKIKKMKKLIILVDSTSNTQKNGESLRIESLARERMRRKKVKKLVKEKQKLI